MVDLDIITRTTAVAEQFTDLRTGVSSLLPQKIAVLAQGQTGVIYDTMPFDASSASDVAILGRRSQAYAIARELFSNIATENVGTVEVSFYPLAAPSGGTAAGCTITPSGTSVGIGRYRVNVNGVLSDEFTVSSGALTVSTVVDAIVAACAASPNLPATAEDNTTNAGIICAWVGASGNAMIVSVEAVVDSGVTFTVSAVSGGAGTPDITEALGAFGTRHETIVINPMPYTDTTTLDEIQEAGEARWGEQVKLPFICFTGSTEATRATVTAITNARKTDRINSILCFPGCQQFPFVACAAAVAKIARTAHTKPAVGYGGIPCATLDPGTDAQQWVHGERNTAKKLGASNSTVENGQVVLNDVVTCYHPDGEDTPPYREVVTIVKLMNMIYLIDRVYSAREWAAAPIVPESSIATLPEAKRPSQVKAAIVNVLQSAESQAIIASWKAVFKAMTATINAANSNRLDITIPVAVTGNANVKAINLVWGFNYISE